MTIEIDEATKPLLQKFGFEEAEGKPKLYYKKVDEGTVAYIDFRKHNGRRFATINNEIVDNEDSIEILKQFKEERDKILQSSSADPHRSNLTQSFSTPDNSEQIGVKPTPQGKETVQGSSKSSGDVVERQNNNIACDVGQENTLSNHTSPQDVKIVPAPNSPNLYEFFYRLVGENGIIELFSDMTGYLKTAICVKTVSDALVKGKKALYIDTEGKTGLYNKKLLMKSNCYKYIPLWEDVIKTVKSLGDYDLLIIDSVGLPVSIKASGIALAEQGKMWSEMMSLIGNPVRVWATKNKALVLFTNQAKSDMMKSEEEKRRMDAVGDKVHFVPNIILKAVNKSKVPGKYDAITKTIKLPETVVTVLSHRSPDFIDDMVLFKVYKQDDNLRIEIPENVAERMMVLKS